MPRLSTDDTMSDQEYLAKCEQLASQVDAVVAGSNNGIALTALCAVLGRGIAMSKDTNQARAELLDQVMQEIVFGVDTWVQVQAKEKMN